MSDKGTMKAANWVGYSGMAAAFLAVVPKADGQVVYTDVDPDSVLTNGTFDIDFDTDGTVDLSLVQGHFTYSSDQVQSVTIHLPDGNQAIGEGADGYSYPAVLASGAPIAQDNTGFGSYADGILGVAYPNYQYGLWPGQTGFLGCRFLAGDGQLHYAWVKLSVSGDAQTCTILGFGYESAPNGAINAGDMGVASVPETGRDPLALQVVPNPVNDVATLILPNNIGGSSSISLLNSLGMVLLSSDVTGDRHYALNMAGYAPGIYFVRLQRDGEVIFRKVTKY